MALDRRFNPSTPPDDPAERPSWEVKRTLWTSFRATNDPAAFTVGIDLFFGGGTYDHGKAHKQGLTVEPWPGGLPPSLSSATNGFEVIPTALGGERWRSTHYIGTALSTFGICYNPDRLRDIGITSPPTRWDDLADPRYFRRIGLADPTKSGSITKAFEMIIHEQCTRTLLEAGFTTTRIDQIEAGPKSDIPPAYQLTLEQGWFNGLCLVQQIGANARYFTDGAGRVPIDVACGDAAAGLAIDFYGRYQAECTRAPDGTQRMIYITPTGGSSVSADPISLLRGAPNPKTARRFIEFTLSPEGQQLWNSRVGTPGGPEKFALRRLPIRRDFYPSTNSLINQLHIRHLAHSVDDLADPTVNPYALAQRFTYHSRWTARHFALHRHLIRAMCLDASVELQRAWSAILAAGGPEACPEAMQLLQRLPDTPEPLTWGNASSYLKQHGQIETMRDWTHFYRRSYDEAYQAATRATQATP